jgi:hypothetical protein
MAAGELRALHLGGALHQAGEVVGDDLVGDGGLERRTMSAAASVQPMCSYMSTPESSTEPGLTLSWPAYLGAVPWVASKMPWPVT